MEINKIILGECIEEMKKFPDNSIDAVITDPPYGLEFMGKDWDKFKEGKNIAGGTTGEGTPFGRSKALPSFFQLRKGVPQLNELWQQAGIPFRFAVEMMDRGWILRNTLIWYKRNCLPSPVKDRFTIDFEYIFFFTKSKKYYFETQYEEHITNENRSDGIIRNRELMYNSKENILRGPSNLKKIENEKANLPNDYSPQEGQEPLSTNFLPKSSYPHELQSQICFNSSSMESDEENGINKSSVKAKFDNESNLIKNIGVSSMSARLRKSEEKYIPKEKRNKRCVWDIPPRPFSEAHFAVFPPELIETPIKAGCPKFICNKCGKPKFPVYEPTEEYKKILEEKRGSIGNALTETNKQAVSDYKLVGYSPTCSCSANFIPGVVLDPFIGSGTTGLVALKNGLRFIGIEISSEYIEIAKRRLKPYLEQRKL